MNYTCPYCGHHSTIVGSDAWDSWSHIYMDPTEKGEIGFGIQTIRCVNPKCNKLFLEVRLTKSGANRHGGIVEGALIQKWQLLPESSAKVLPEFIPLAIDRKSTRLNSS